MVLSYINELFEGDILEKPLVKNPYLANGIVAAYIIFVYWLGPALMKNRKAFELKYVMILYDFAQSSANAYLSYNIFYNIWLHWDLRCNLQDRPELPMVMEKMLRFGYQVYLVKFVDLIDTCIFVFRRKSDQVSFLHVFHHSLVCILSSWYIPQAKYMGFYVILGLGINTFVHVIVYLYYGLAAFGPHMNKYLWWKEYLTVFQIMQFFVILGYFVYGFISGCEKAGLKEMALFTFTFIILLMFMDFYKRYGKVKND